jgi:AI-2E family transporter
MKQARIPRFTDRTVDVCADRTRYQTIPAYRVGKVGKRTRETAVAFKADLSSGHNTAIALVGDTLWLALLPAELYLGIHRVEGESVTPMLLAKRFNLNPVLVIGSLAFWFWMWGVPGAILSVSVLEPSRDHGLATSLLNRLRAFGLGRPRNSRRPGPKPEAAS